MAVAAAVAIVVDTIAAQMAMVSEFKAAALNLGASSP